MLKAFATAAVAAAVFASVPAHAAPLTSAQLLHQFSLISFGDVDAGPEVYGRAYVAGNLSGGTFNSRVERPDSEYDELVVGGNVTGGTVTVQNGGDATVGGNVASSVFELNGHGTLRAGGSVTAVANQGTKLANQAGEPGFDERFPTYAEGTLKATSAQIAALGGASVSAASKLVIDGSLGLLALDLAVLAAANEIELVNVSAATPLIVNVSGASGEVKANFLGGPFAAASYLLWNFHEATDLALKTQFFGTVLAPNAFVSTGNDIEGGLFVRSAQLRGQIHLQPYAGKVPAPVPVPAALPLIASAFAGLAFLTRRRRAA